MSSATFAPLVLVDVVGLTDGLLAHAPRLEQLADQGWKRHLSEPLPAVTCTAQAAMLTGTLPSRHGIVGNGWLFRDTMEVRFWQQSNRLLQAEPLYQTARRKAESMGRTFRCAKLFWWFNHGADVAVSVTPKPHYGAGGEKVFGIAGTPPSLPDRLERELGPFPFPAFWGPTAGLPASQWIARCAAAVLRDERPNLTLVYVPHLDYDPQRFGPGRCDRQGIAKELDDAVEPILDAARRIGARVWVVSEYGHRDVSGPVYPNRVLRTADLLCVRPGPFGEMLDTFSSRAFAVCDHQLCHVYVHQPGDRRRVKELLEAEPGVDRLYVGDERAEIALDHDRAGEIVALAKPDRWFAYPYWLEDRVAPDFARTVDIHRKPGFDPCEMFFDPSLVWPKGRALRRLIQKKLGFRTLFDVIPLDAGIVGGSHGLIAATTSERPLLIADGPQPDSADPIPMTDVHRLVLSAIVPDGSMVA